MWSLCWANKHLRLWIFPQVVRLLVVQATLCVGEGELQAGVCGRSHGCVTSKSLQGCLLEDLGALWRGFVHVSGEILKCHGNNYWPRKEGMWGRCQATRRGLAAISQWSWTLVNGFRTLMCSGGRQVTVTWISHRQGAAIPWDLAQDGSLSHLNSEGVSCTSSFSALTSTCQVMMRLVPNFRRVERMKGMDRSSWPWILGAAPAIADCFWCENRWSRRTPNVVAV